jgi:hypothetical protein
MIAVKNTTKITKPEFAKNVLATAKTVQTDLLVNIVPKDGIETQQINALTHAVKDIDTTENKELVMNVPMNIALTAKEMLTIVLIAKITGT